MAIPKHWRADLALLLVAVVWGSAFVAQRTAMQQQLGPFAFNTLRFALGSLTLLPVIAARDAARRAHSTGARGPAPAPPRSLSALFQALSHNTILPGGMVLGTILFGAASCQQIGMMHTTAGKGGFITGLYIVIVPLLLRLVWKERAAWSCWLGAGLATLGLFLLSMQSEWRLAPGDGWVLVSAFLWACHVIAVGRWVPGRDPLRLALAQYLVCALLSVVAALTLEGPTWGNLELAWPSVLYTGVLSIGLGYTIQVMAQRYTLPTHTAIILSLESVFAALAGWLLVGEVMTTRMSLGAILMLVGALVAQWTS